jgi:hypothetical protein
MPHHLTRLVTALWLSLAAAMPAFAQEASVSGTVVDGSKAVVPGVTITATNIDTGVPTVAVSDEAGRYRLQNLGPGTYKVQAELTGFSTVVIPTIELRVGQNATLPFELKLADLNETITVTGEAPFVDVSSSQVSGNVNPRQMEALPLQGRNWMELSKMVKGMTANEVSINPGVSDDMFQLNLDGQQVTQKISGGFGQPRFSREAIAEFQIITNMFDITQGRSAGLQVQAVSRSGTNNLSGSLYGFFRDDRINAKDPITNTVLPYESQQVGGSLGGPIIQNRLHYFASYEYEREPGTRFAAPTALPGQTFTIPFKNSQWSFLGRADYQLTNNDRLSVRGSYWDWSNPFVLATTGHPSNASVQTKQATNVLGTWSRVLRSNLIQEVKVGYNNFQWANEGLPQVGNTYEYRFPGLTVGKPYNYPQWLYQHYTDGRYDLTWNKGTHDVKFGAEFIYARVNALWYLQREGIMTFTSVPADINSRIPFDAPFDVSRWNLTGLEGIAQRFERNYNRGDWTLEVPGPTWAIWLGDTWRVGSRLTVNFGVRWDVAWNAAATPDTVENTIPIDNGSAAAGTDLPGIGAGDFGYRNDIRDLGNIAPRAGFTWNVGGTNDFVVRGGTGLYWALPQTQYTYSPQLFSRMVTASFNNDGLPGFLTDPTRGIETFEQATAKAPPQAARIFSPDFTNAYTWQSSLGFQKQLGALTGFELDLVHYQMYNDLRTVDPNLVYDAATGYNRPAAVRPNPQWGQIVYFLSTGRQNYTAVAAGLNRRLQKGMQGGLTYTWMAQMHDDGTASLTNPAANNQFDYLDGEYATSTMFQRHTLRFWGLFELPWGFSTSATYAYGSGNRFNATIPTAPYGKPGQNRLNLTAAGGPAGAITVPAEMEDRWDGPMTVASGAVIPRNALSGTAYHRLDLRLSKDIPLPGRAKIQLIGEVFNVFNHGNYTAFFTQLSATAPATTARFGQPSAASIPRQGQVGFRASW